MSPTGFEPTIAVGERPQTYAWDRAATGTGSLPLSGYHLFSSPPVVLSGRPGTWIFLRWCLIFISPPPPIWNLPYVRLVNLYMALYCRIPNKSSLDLWSNWCPKKKYFLPLHFWFWWFVTRNPMHTFFSVVQEDCIYRQCRTTWCSINSEFWRMRRRSWFSVGGAIW
jgi:hypothetical protein